MYFFNLLYVPPSVFLYLPLLMSFGFFSVSFQMISVWLLVPHTKTVTQNFLFPKSCLKSRSQGKSGAHHRAKDLEDSPTWGSRRASLYLYDLENRILEWEQMNLRKGMLEKAIQCFLWFPIACVIDSKFLRLALRIFTICPHTIPPACSLATTPYPVLLPHWFVIIPYTDFAFLCACNILWYVPYTRPSFFCKILLMLNLQNLDQNIPSLISQLNFLIFCTLNTSW